MTFDQLIIPLLTAIPPTIAAVAALVVSIRNKRVTEENGRKTEAVHLQINSRMTEFIELIKESSYDKGVKSEIDKQKLKSPEDPASWDFMKELPPK